MLDPINFAGLYQQGEARAAQESSETDNQPN
jgi:preprotein translocase subunit SecB